MKKHEIQNNSAKKSRCPNWNQNDTDLLCDLIREIGLRSVLNSRTNGTTKEIKKADWDAIAERFNSHPSVATQRNVDAIIARYKEVMQVMRNHFALERNNATQTGGGSSSVPKMEISGAMLELRSYYGHLLSGLPSYDCDSMTSNADKQSVAPNASTLEAVSSENTSETVEVSDSVGLNAFSSNGSITVPTFRPISLTAPVSNPLVSQTSNQIQQPLQYFATGAQRRRRAVMSNVDEARRKLIDEERERMAAFGKLRMQLYQDESAARLDEIRQRKSLNAALHQKQLEFWDIAIQRIQCNDNLVNISPQSSQIVNVISAPSSGVETACKASNAVTESDRTQHSFQANSIFNEHPPAFETFVSEVLDNHRTHNTQTNDDSISDDEDDPKDKY